MRGENDHINMRKKAAQSLDYEKCFCIAVNAKISSPAAKPIMYKVKNFMILFSIRVSFKYEPFQLFLDTTEYIDKLIDSRISLVHSRVFMLEVILDMKELYKIYLRE